MRTVQLVDFEVFVKALERAEQEGCHVVGFCTDGDHDAFYVRNPKHDGGHYTVRYDAATQQLSCNCLGSHVFGAPWCKHRSVVVAFMIERW